MGKKVLVLDLDGVLCEETGRWDDFSKRELLVGIKWYLEELSRLYTLDIYTARKSEEAFWDTISFFIDNDIQQYIRRIVFDKPIGIAYIDDRSFKSFKEFTTEVIDVIWSKI